MSLPWVTSIGNVKHVAVSASNAGNNTLVVAVPDRQIRVLGIMLYTAAAVDVRLENGADGSGGQPITGVCSIGANMPFCLPYVPCGWGDCAINTLLNLELGAAVQVSGTLIYQEKGGQFQLWP